MTDTKKQKKWHATGAVAGSTYIGVVEADTEEEAIAKAWDLADVILCHKCSQHISDPEVEDITVWEEEEETK